MTAKRWIGTLLTCVCALASASSGSSGSLQDNGAVDSHYAFIRPAPTANPWRKSFYDEDHDFGDYSRHFTRTAAANRNSAAAPPPSGPYFAYEWKEMNQVDDLIPGSSSAQLGWNSLDYYDYLEAVDHAGNRYHPEQFYPPLTYKRPGLIRDQGHRKPTALTNHRVNPNMQHGTVQYSPLINYFNEYFWVCTSNFDFWVFRSTFFSIGSLEKCLNFDFLDPSFWFEV